MYFQDIITDLVVERAPIRVKGVKNAFVHTGMLQSAKYVQQKLLEEQILENAFGTYEVSIYHFYLWACFADLVVSQFECSAPYFPSLDGYW